MNYREALAWLYATQRFGIKLGLENSRRLFRELSRSAGLQSAAEAIWRSPILEAAQAKFSASVIA